MPFPDELPTEVAKAGRLVAQFRFEVFGVEATHVLRSYEHYIFLVVGANKRYTVFHGMYGTKTGVYHPGTQVGATLRWLDNATTALIDSWRQQHSLSLVEGEIRRDTEEGKAFAERFVDGNPEMEPLIRFVPVATASAPRCQILPRSEWMAIHYPQPTAA